MALIICKECKKEYSDTLPACPHCGYVRPKENRCATCGTVYYGPQKICAVCGFPINENHAGDLTSPTQKHQQKEAYEKETERIKQLLLQFKEKLEITRDQKLLKWHEEFEHEIQILSAEIENKQNVLSGAGVFAVGKKKQLRQEIESLQTELDNVNDKMNGLDEAKKRMTAKIKQQCGEVAAFRSTYASDLKKYLKAFKADLERNNDERSKLGEEAKDRIDHLLAELDRPVEMNQMIDMLWEKYPEYKKLVAGYFKTACTKLIEEGRIEIVANTGFQAQLFSKKHFHNIPCEPDADEIFNPISEIEKYAYVKSVIEEMGDKYNAYMDEIASKSGWKEVRIV